MKKEVIVLALEILLAQAATAQSSAAPAAPKPVTVLAAQTNASVPAMKTAGEVMKNVQVLRDVPASQWNSVMAFVAGSLGVSCEHCHAQPYESDAKKAKQVARSMMKMVREINANNFDGRPQVTCNTCHRGSLQPKPIPSLWSKTPDEVDAYKKQRQADRAETGEPVTPAAETSRSFPSADKVFAAYRQAVGSAPYTSTHASVTVAGDIQPGQTIDVDMVMPDKIMVHAFQPGRETRVITNGGRGWVIVPQGQRELAPSDIENLRKSFADVFLPLKRAEAQTTGKVTGAEKVGDRTYTVVEARVPTGLDRLYFDAQSGLLNRVYSEISVAGFGIIPRETTFEDYRDVNGLKLPFLVTVRTNDDRVVTKISEMQTNIAIDPAKFDPPRPPAPPK